MIFWLHATNEAQDFWLCVREKEKNIPTYIYLRSKAFEYVERGEGKRVNVFFLHIENGTWLYGYLINTLFSISTFCAIF